jgi:hypothetical protein
MHIFIAIWPDMTATLQILTSRDGNVLLSNLKDISNSEEPQIFEVVPTSWSPSEFKLKSVRVSSDMRIIAKKIS